MSVANYEFKFREFMNGERVFINTKICDALPEYSALALIKTYTKMINNDSFDHDHDAFRVKHQLSADLDMKNFRYRCMILMFDVFMSCSKIVPYNNYAVLDNMRMSLATRGMCNIPIIINNNGRWEESTSDIALDRMCKELMNLKKEMATQTRTYKHDNGSMTLRPRTRTPVH